MDFKELFKNTKIQWVVFLIITIVISGLFPTHYDFAKNKSQLYLSFLTFFSCILFVLVFFLINFLMRRLVKKRLNDKQINKEIFNGFITCWLIQIIKYFTIGLLNQI
jgi:uncharacterized membrane protein YbhN (UPF0104 family)